MDVKSNIQKHFSPEYFIYFKSVWNPVPHKIIWNRCWCFINTRFHCCSSGETSNPNPSQADVFMGHVQSLHCSSRLVSTAAVVSSQTDFPWLILTQQMSPFWGVQSSRRWPHALRRRELRPSRQMWRAENSESEPRVRHRWSEKQNWERLCFYFCC